MIRSVLPMATLSAAAALSACGGDDGSPSTPTTCGSHSGAGVLADFDVPCDPGGNGILITASGEAFAKQGYAFPPASPDDVFFVDGWQITYDRILTTFDHVTLSRGPDKVPTDQSQCDDGKGSTAPCGTGSTVLAEADGPFAIDLHQGGARPDADGAANDAAPIAALTRLADGAAFDPTTKYAFGFETVAAATAARNVNLDAAGLADYQDMIARGYTTLLVGTATWQGNNHGSDSQSGCTVAGTSTYDFTKLPKTVAFKLGFKAPTAYRNAQNPDLTGDAFAGEEHPRGIQTTANQSTIAQATFHIDHVFWESFVHDSPAHFDSFAARYVGQAAPTATAPATMEDFQGYAFTPFVDAAGAQVPWRQCVDAATYTPPGSGAMAFDTLDVAVDPGGNPANVIRDFYDYVTYNHSTFGHLNADGLSFVDRQYPSPK